MKIQLQESTKVADETKNCSYFNPNTINAMITKKEVSEMCFKESKGSKPAGGMDIMTKVIEYVLTQYSLK